MTKPDWSKAPEWATMYGTVSQSSFPAWSDGVFYQIEMLGVVFPKRKFGESSNVFGVDEFKSIESRQDLKQRELEQLQADIDKAFEANATLSEFLHAKGYRKP